MERKSDTVILLGQAQSNRHLVPWDEDAEVWSLNRAWRDISEREKEKDPEAISFVKRWDRWFEIHSYPTLVHDIDPEKGEQLKHIDWLRRDHGKPIYMMEKFPEFPSSVRLPLEDLLALFPGRHYTSTMTFMMGMVIMLGFKRCGFYGFEMGMAGEYMYQKPGLMYLTAKMESAGIEIFSPVKSMMVWDPLYAYEEMRGPYSTHIEGRRMQHERTREKIMADMLQSVGAMRALKELKEKEPMLASSHVLNDMLRDAKETAEKEQIAFNMHDYAYKELGWVRGIINDIGPSFDTIRGGDDEPQEAQAESQ